MFELRKKGRRDSEMMELGEFTAGVRRATAKGDKQNDEEESSRHRLVVMIQESHDDGAADSIEPLVGAIEGWDRNVQDFEFADGAMAATGFDQDGRQRFDRHDFPVELQVAFAFEDDVDLCEAFVVVGLRVLLNVNEVDCRDRIVH